MGWLPHRKIDVHEYYEDIKGFANAYSELCIQLTNQLTNTQLTPQFKTEADYKQQFQEDREKPLEEVDYTDMEGGSIGEPPRS